MKFENTVVINKPPKEVFAYLADLERLPDWNYAIKRTLQVTEGPIRAGTRYTQERTLPQPMTEELEITVYQPDSLLGVAGGFGPFPAGRATYRLEAMSGGKTLLRNEIELEAQGPLRLAAPFVTAKVKSAVRENLEVLKKIVETK